MTGEELKCVLMSMDESLANIARRLDMTPQNLDGILKTKDIKTGLIERLCSVYDKPVEYFFGEHSTSTKIVTTHGDMSPASGNGNVSVVMSDVVMAERVKHLEELLTEKNERIAELKERIDELKSR